MKRDTIFENQTKEMPDWWDKPARTMLDPSETLAMAKVPGSIKLPGRNVENVIRSRRGHGY
jgi:hypothetical protein